MKGKFTNALSLALVLAMLVSAVAFADTIAADADSIDGVQSSQNLGEVAPGETRTQLVSFILTCAGKNHVDYNQIVNITFNLTSSTVPGGSLSATNSSIGAIPDEWPNDTTGGGSTNCPPTPTTLGSNLASTVTITAPTTPGTYTYVVKYDIGFSPVGSDDANDITGPSPSATFTLTVKEQSTNTHPTVVVTGVTDGATYEFGSVPSAVCEVTDAEDGNFSFAATLSAITGPLDAYGLGSQTASCSFTDSGGLSATPASATYTIVDTTDPEVLCDSADGLWHAADVSIPCTASDNVALANSADANFSLVTNVLAGTEDANASTNSYDVYDVAGNVVTAGPVSGNMVDKKAPTNISFVGGSIANGSSYYFGFVPAGPSSCTADDGGSGLASCNVTGGGTTVGSHSFTATATDNVGNFDTATMNYNVSAWTLDGFYQPVDMNGVFNVVKGGSTVPLKFRIFAGSTELTDPSHVDYLKYGSVACDAGAPNDAIETLSSGETSLRYDWTSGQFVYNWKTPKTTGCFSVTVKTDDGSTLVAYFKLK